MVKAVIFDLDGTLIQTEVLKARSYALAVHELTRQEVSEEDVLDVFSEFVGLSRQEVVAGVSKEFSESLRRHLKVRDRPAIEEAVIKRRLRIYRQILDDDTLLAEHFCPYSMGLFHKLLQEGFLLVLATMSHLPEAKKVTKSMGIFEKFDLVLTRDDVEYGKPSPDIYHLALTSLGLEKLECLVMEDSVNGILAAQNAGLPVFALTNEITRESVHNCRLLDPKWIVDELSELESRVVRYIEGQNKVDPKQTM